MTTSRTRHLSSFHVELARLGQATSAESAWVEEHLRACAPCAEMARELGTFRDEMGGAAATRTRARVRERLALAARRRRRFGWLGGGLLVPALAALALFVWSGRRGAPPLSGEPEIGVKGGGPGLLLAARRGTRVFPVHQGEALRAGDQIRFVLEQVRQPFVLIASVDGAGRANIYVPYEGSASVAVHAGTRIEIPGSIIIDESPGPERIFAFLSQRPVDAARVRAALTAVGMRGPAAIRGVTRLDVGADEQLSMLVEKAAP